MLRITEPLVSPTSEGVNALFLMIRRTDVFFVVSDVFRGSSENSSDSSDVDGHTSDNRSDVKKSNALAFMIVFVLLFLISTLYQMMKKLAIFSLATNYLKMR